MSNHIQVVRFPLEEKRQRLAAEFQTAHPEMGHAETLKHASRQIEIGSKIGVSASVRPTFASARQILEMCAIAGLSAEASLAFLRPSASLDVIRGEILEAKAEQAGSEIHSHIMPDAGTGPSSDPAKSGLVKRAEAMAAEDAAKKAAEAARYSENLPRAQFYDRPAS